MDEVLLSYYNRELAYLRKLGAEFAEQHPKIAGRLRLDRDTVEDPHVSRLIESFAFLTARIRHKLDDSFPELTEALMGLLYPDYHAPIPSLSIARIRLAPERHETRKLAAGTALLTRSNPAGEVRYRISYDTAVYPLTIDHAQFSAQPFKAPALPGGERIARTQGLLRLSLTAEPGTTLEEIRPRRLRLFLNGQPQLTFRLYEFLLRHTVAIAVGEHPKDPNATFHKPGCVQPVGLTEDEAVLPGDGRTGAAHRLLSEYFVFPEKFLFVDLRLPEAAWSGQGERTNLYLYFDAAHPELTQGVSEDNVLLGCTPIINLFRQRLESMAAADMGYETRLAVDTVYDRYADIHTLERVYATDAEGQRIDLQPFYGSHRSGHATGAAPLYWHIRRENSHWLNGRVSPGTDTYLSFVDSGFQITNPHQRWIIGGEALCTNRDLPNKLPFGPEEPQLTFESDIGAGLRVSAVTAPTPTLQPRLHEASRWQLVTQLSLQHFTGPEGLQTLRETLRLYDFKQGADSASIIDGLVGLRAETATARVVRGGRAALCQGTHITLEVDEHFYSGSGIYLFSAVLSEFFAQYCTINSFVQLTVTVKQRPDYTIQWPPRSGKQTLL